jgi:dipeptidyl aminopeptidase/acylaminoacyl peptidase
MLEAGFAVALPNARGSTGYGHDWAAEVWADWGGRCFDDLMRVTEALESRKDVGKIAAMGGSFGGYMTAWIGGNTERFAALVDHAGLYDLRAFKGVTDFPGFFSAMIGGDLERWSPHRFVDRWKTPTLVIHGDKDYRVPVGEALSLFEALQTRGVPSELLLFPDENHWILKPRNVRQWYEAVIEFLGRHLR